MKRLWAVVDEVPSKQRPIVNIYLAALSASCLAAVATWMLIETVGVTTPFLLGIGAVAFSAWYGGLGPALLAGAVILVTGMLLVSPGDPVQRPVNLILITLFMIAIAINGRFFQKARRDAETRMHQLVRRETYLESVLQTLPASIIVTDRSGAIYAVNRAARALLGIDQDADIDAQGIGDLMYLEGADGDSDAVVVERLERMALTGTLVDAFRRQGGSMKLAVAISQMQASRATLLTIYLRDETATLQAKRKIAEMQAEMAQFGRATALATMGSAIAHELNQPLAAAATYIEAIRKQLSKRAPLPPETGEAIDGASSQIFRAADVLKGLRVFAKAQPMEPRWLAVKDVVGEAANLAHFVANENRAQFDIGISPDTGLIWADRVQIQQVLINLIHNAVEAMAGQRRRVVRIKVEASDDQAAFSIIDTGPGPAPAIRARLFLPFNTSKRSGLGVGLAISKSIIEAHGGSIECETGDGGTTFRFSLKHKSAGSGGKSCSTTSRSM